MKREEEIIETDKFIYSPSSGIPQSLSLRVGFIEGAKWADEHPCMSEEEQVGMEGLGMVWQKKHLINKAIDILIDLSNDGYLIDIHNCEEFEKQFIKKMEE